MSKEVLEVVGGCIDQVFAVKQVIEKVIDKDN